MAANLPKTDGLATVNIPIATSELSYDRKWPRRWRLLLIVGVSAALWTGIVLAIRML